MSSEPLTELMSVSNTPDFKFATSTFESELPVPSASNVLFVNVNVSLAMLASCASTYAFTLCCDGGLVAQFVPNPSSSIKLKLLSAALIVTTPAESVVVVTFVPPCM